MEGGPERNATRLGIPAALGSGRVSGPTQSGWLDGRGTFEPGVRLDTGCPSLTLKQSQIVGPTGKAHILHRTNAPSAAAGSLLILNTVCRVSPVALAISDAPASLPSMSITTSKDSRL